MMTEQDTPEIDEVLERLVEWALRLHRNWNVSEPHAHLDADIEYSSDELALAARELVRATELLPRSSRPVGWNDKPQSGLLPVQLSEGDLDFLVGKLARDPAAEDLMRRLAAERDAFYRHGQG